MSAPRRRRPDWRAPVGLKATETFRRAQRVADAHVLWAASAGLHPADVLASIRSRRVLGDWTVVRVELARAWLDLQRRPA